MQKVYFIDTTLRDGEQSAGVAFNKSEKVQIARMLDRIGIDFIEAGIPAMGSMEIEAIQEILNLGLKAKISTWNRANIGDVKASLKCGAKYIHISAPVSDLQIKYKLNRNRVWVLESLKRAVSYAKEFGTVVSVGAEDASRADIGFLIKFCQVAQQEGVERMRFADTLGILEPFTTKEKVSRIIQETGVDVEIHTHNDFGMATANTLAAYKGGAKYISTTISGLGERAGNSSFQEALNILQKLEGLPININEKDLAKLINYVAKAARRPQYVSVV
ncbi:MAG: homocitrate synthase [Firmicutes bacterium]|nr:homocitrate synthase [Bacillota bacterium]